MSHHFISIVLEAAVAAPCPCVLRRTCVLRAGAACHWCWRPALALAAGSTQHPAPVARGRAGSAPLRACARVLLCTRLKPKSSLQAAAARDSRDVPHTRASPTASSSLRPPRLRFDRLGFASSHSVNDLAHTATCFAQCATLTRRRPLIELVCLHVCFPFMECVQMFLV